MLKIKDRVSGAFLTNSDHNRRDHKITAVLRRENCAVNPALFGYNEMSLTTPPWKHRNHFGVKKKSKSTGISYKADVTRDDFQRRFAIQMKLHEI